MAHVLGIKIKFIMGKVALIYEIVDFQRLSPIS